jgi:hypothetical protein
MRLGHLLEDVFDSQSIIWDTILSLSLPIGESKATERGKGVLWRRRYRLYLIVFYLLL